MKQAIPSPCSAAGFWKYNMQNNTARLKSLVLRELSMRLQR